MGGPSSKPMFYVYVDNIGLIGPSRSEVQSSMNDVVKTFEGLGLQCHEVQPVQDVLL